MEAPVKGGMALYYNKLLELQEKLRERERAHCKKLQFQCRKLIDRDRKRHERNEEIIRSLEEIEMRMRGLTSKTRNLEALRFSRESFPESNQNRQHRKIERDDVHSSMSQNNFESYDGKNFNGSRTADISYTDKKMKGTLYNHRFNKTSDELNSMAEYMTNSISSRYYKKDLPGSASHPNYSFDFRYRNSEKGVNDVLENRNEKKDNFSYKPQVENIEGYAEEITELKEPILSNDSVEQRNNFRNLYSDIDLKKYSQENATSENENYMKNNQEASEIDILKRMGTEEETSEYQPYKELTTVFNQNTSESKVIISSHPEENEAPVHKQNHEKYIPEMHPEYVKDHLESQKANEYHDLKEEKDITNENAIIIKKSNTEQVNENHKDCSKLVERMTCDDYDDSKVDQTFYQDQSRNSNQTSKIQQSNEYNSTQFEEIPVEHYDHHDQPFQAQYGLEGQPVTYSDIQSDEHGQSVQYIEQSFHHDDTNQNSNTNSFLNDGIGGKGEEMETTPSHSGEIKKSVSSLHTNDQGQAETQKTHEEAENSDGIKEECNTLTENNDVNLTSQNNLSVGQDIVNNEESLNPTDGNPVITEESQREGQEQSSDTHLKNQEEYQPQQYEEGNQILQYDENGQPILHYDENGQPFQLYDQNAGYHYEQHYDNSSHYEGNNQEYQQYEQYDGGETYQQQATEDNPQLYLNQVGQYDEHNLQNYQYHEGMSSDNTGVYMNQDGHYNNDPQYQQTFQNLEGRDIPVEHTDFHISQVEQYDRTDHIQPQAYEQPQGMDIIGGEDSEMQVPRKIPESSGIEE